MLTNLIGGTISKTDMKGTNVFFLVIMLLLVLIIKVVLVQWSYNKIFPLLMYNVNGDDNQDFKTITFTESIIVVILFNSLFQ
jgi:hypothetical protein|tara:strand:+ start:1713 stop:1958 length:246 start_codon:yes stop_codon:yes gene_type:complete